eukprot:1154628-Pelagomonas_calceolata.AAC.8
MEGKETLACRAVSYLVRLPHFGIWRVAIGHWLHTLTESSPADNSRKEKEKKKENVGRVTLPTSIKEKKTHWLIKSREPPPPREKKERQN